MKRVASAILATLLSVTAALAYPIAKERELGERFSLEAAAELPLLREVAVVEFVNRLGNRIVAKLGSPQPFDYRFSVVRDGQLNAFAVPGGFLYVNSGLILRASNDSELAGVLGHEIAHSHAHHIVRQQEKGALASYAAIAGMLLSVIHPAIGAAAAGAGAAAQLQYSREFEQEADYLGLRYMREAGYEPHGMASFMKKVGEEHRTLPLDSIPPYLLSHPLTDERITNLQAATKGAPARTGWEQPSIELRRVQAILAGLTGDRAGARSRYEKRAARGGDDLALFGILLVHQGEAAAGRAALEKARASGVAGLEGDIGLARLREGDATEAITSLKNRLEVAPDDAVARATLGEALLQSGDFAGATRELERVLADIPELDEVEYALGQSYGRGGNAGLGMLHLARAFEMRGDLERAISHYERAEKILPAESPEVEEAKERIEVLSDVSRRRILGRRRR